MYVCENLCLKIVSRAGSCESILETQLFCKPGITSQPIRASEAWFPKHLCFQKTCT